MTLQEELRIKLENFPRFRERKFRGEYLAVLALRKLGLEERYNFGAGLSLKDLVSFYTTYDSYRHEYDAVQKDNPRLQGEDYKDGKALAQAKQIEFGYEGGYPQLTKIKVED